MSHDEKQLRVAAYCRVSTDGDDQASSLNSQKKYFRQYVGQNPRWQLCEVYADEGVTGTSTSKRRAFNRMIADAENHAFDLILTKEISRFARNTLDSILYTRKLKELGIGVIFVNDNINTLDADAELRLTIMSSIAQEESRKTSERVKWGQKRRMEQGVVFGRDMLGYDVRGGKLYINEDGARTVRLIFHKFVNEGKGSHVIARELRETGVKTAAFMKRWSNTAILRVLRNEKYCGDLIQKKTFTPDYLNHKKKVNRGEEEFVILRGHHEPIVSRETFEKARAELARRSPGEKQKARHSNRYCFSGKIKCGVCGASFVPRTKKRRDGSVYKAWRCLENVRHGSARVDGERIGCSAPSLNDEYAKGLLQYIVSNSCDNILIVVDDLTATIREMLTAECEEDETARLRARLTSLTGKRRRLLELYMDKSVAENDFKSLNAEYDAKTTALNRELQERLTHKAQQQNRDAILAEITVVMRGIAVSGDWDDSLYRHLLDCIIVWKDGGIDVRLNNLPEIWRFARSGRGGYHTGTPVPTSVSTPVISP